MRLDTLTHRTFCSSVHRLGGQLLWAEKGIALKTSHVKMLVRFD